MLSEDDRKKMLRAARNAVTDCVQNNDVIPSIELKEMNYEPMGVFVTLRKKGELRGCIGYVEGIKPLDEAISEMSEAAATRDPRFPPLSESELQDVEIEISLLSPPEKIDSPDSIEIGKHGLIVKQGIRKGLLLPQVATENNWDRQTLLEHTCLKANLLSNAYLSDETEIYVFTAEVFEEQN